MKPITQAEYERLPDKVLYAVAKPRANSDEHDYFVGDGSPARRGNTMVKYSAYLCSMENPESDGIGLLKDNGFQFIPLKNATKKAPAKKAETKSGQHLNPAIKFAPFVPFSDVGIPVEQFPVEALPEPFRGYCEAVATSYQVDCAMSACCILSVLSAIFQKCGYWVQVSTDWKEPINLYLMATAAPSERKSPVLRDVLSPLTDAIETWNEQQAETIDWQRKKIEVLKRKQDNISTMLSKGSKKISEEDLRTAQSELREAEKTLLQPQEWIVDDCTPEALALVLRDNEEVAAVLSGEGGSILGILAGRYSAPGSGANIDLFLKGFSVEPTVIHRIGRQTVSLKHPRLTVLLMAQPSLLADFVSNDSFSGRGLCARFLYALPRSFVGTREFISKPVSKEIRTAYENTVSELAQYALEWKNLDSILTISPGAAEELQKYHDSVEPTRPEMSDMMQSWSGKLEGVICRIAALLYLAQHGGQVGEIDTETMRCAVRIGKYFATMSEYALGFSGGSKTQRDALSLLKKFQSDDFAPYREAGYITRKELLDKVKCSRFASVESMHDGLKELTDRGYICQITAKNGKVGRPSPIILFNPEAFERSAPG